MIMEADPYVRLQQIRPSPIIRNPIQEKHISAQPTFFLTPPEKLRSLGHGRNHPFIVMLGGSKDQPDLRVMP